MRDAAATASDSGGETLTFAPNVLRVTDRGAHVERTGEQLLTNSSLIRQGAGLPVGWRLPAGATVENIVSTTFRGLPALVFTIRASNSNGVDTTFRVDFEQAAGIPIPAGREAIFHGLVQLVSSSNAAQHAMRLIPRLADGAGTADQGVQLFSAGAVSEFKCLPVIPDEAVTLHPGVSFVVPAVTIGVVRIMVAGLQLESGRTATSFIPRAAAVEVFTPRFPNPGFAGAAPGTPGTLPNGWSQGTMTAYRVLAYDGVTGALDIELTATARVSAGPAGDTLGIQMNIVPPAGPAGRVAGSMGEVIEAGIQAQILNGVTDANPRLNLSARTDTGEVLAGFNTSVSMPQLNLVTYTRRFAGPLPSDGLSLGLQIFLSVPQNQTRVVQMRLLMPRIDLVTVSGDSLSPIRPLDVVRLAAPQRFAGASTVVIEAEQPALVAESTLLSIAFGSGHRLRLVAGPQVGLVVTPPAGAPITLLRPLYAAAGIVRLALSYAAGQVAIGFSDACEGDFASAAVPGLDPATVNNVWLGSDDGVNGMTTVIRSIEVDVGAQSAENLQLRTRDAWAARTFVQPRAGIRAPSLQQVGGYVPSRVEVIGPTHTYGPIGNRYLFRRNGGAAMNDVLPPANSVGSVEGTPARLNIVNDDVVPLSITSAGGLIYPPSGTLPYALAPITTLVIPPGQRALVCADGYNPATQQWQANNENWWFVLRDDDLAALPQEYTFASIYGPPDPANPNRSIIFPPAFAAYNADIGPPRQLAAAAVKQMNRWLLYGNQVDASRGLRFLYDACAADYWKVSTGITTITQLKTQINSTGFPYLGLRDCGSGTPEEHEVIRRWFEDRTDQTIEFFAAQRAQGTSTGSANHYYAAGLAAALTSQISDRNDYLQFAVDVFTFAMEEAHSIPGRVGSLLLEMRRAEKSLQYQFLAMTQLLPLAEILQRNGFDAYGFLDGQLIQCINWSMAAVEDPDIVMAEQARLVSLGLPWSLGITVSEQLPIGFGQDTDPISGEPLFNESRVAAMYLAYRRLTDAQAPWRPIWTPRFQVYDNVYNGAIGGGQSYLYRFPGIALPEIPA
ncbi:MAG: hypothetical protein C0434_08070 [Xanthomonadaceae bacterium]|nr:hypothetical protein [Xanthomonadaceae bacterium]